MRFNLDNYRLIDTRDIFQQIDLLATGATIHKLRSYGCALDSSVLLLNSGKAKDRRWHIRNINKHVAHLMKYGITIRYNLGEKIEQGE